MNNQPVVDGETFIQQEMKDEHYNLWLFTQHYQ